MKSIQSFMRFDDASNRCSHRFESDSNGWFVKEKKKELIVIKFLFEIQWVTIETCIQQSLLCLPLERRECNLCSPLPYLWLVIWGMKPNEHYSHRIRTHENSNIFCVYSVEIVAELIIAFNLSLFPFHLICIRFKPFQTYSNKIHSNKWYTLNVKKEWTKKNIFIFVERKHRHTKTTDIQNGKWRLMSNACTKYKYISRQWAENRTKWRRINGVRACSEKKMNERTKKILKWKWHHTKRQLSPNERLCQATAKKQEKKSIHMTRKHIHKTRD